MRLCPASLLALLALLAGTSLAGQTPTAPSRIAPYANLVPQTYLSGNLPLWANAQSDAGPAAANTSVTLTFLLARTVALQTSFDQLTADQQNPASPRFHQWLTPTQIGDQYGPTLDEVASVSRWIVSQGLQVTSVSPSRTFIAATGPASAAAIALSVAFHLFTVDGQSRLAATTEPSIPTALATVIQSIEGLADTPFHAYNAVHPAAPRPEADALQPFATKASGAHYLFPGDFARIYNIAATTSAGYDGSGIRIAIAGQSRITDSDVTELQAMAGLPAKTPTTILVPTSSDPGLVKGDEDEATLDAIRILTTAPGVQADLVVASIVSGGVSTSIQYAINTLVDPILSISYGACEAAASASSVQFYNTLFQQAAAEGISTIVSSGDSAAAGCSPAFTKPNGAETRGMGNYLCSSTYVTCLGGTLFTDTGLDAAFWSPTNTPNYTSALGYIPEGAWNEPTAVGGSSTAYVIAGSGSGPSAYIAKPAWQIPANTPQDGARDIPDLAFSAANHDGYFACLAYIGTAGDCAKGGGVIFSGTSATAPAMAAIAALLDQRLGTRQGNLNPLLYRLALSNPSAFHDATPATSGVATCSPATPSPCNNSTPGPSTLTGGLAGYPLQVGYDMVTGLGSLDVTNFLNAAVDPTQTPAPASTTTTLTASVATLVAGQTATFAASIHPDTTGIPTGTVQFFSNQTALTGPLPLTTNTVTTPATAFPTAGTFAISAVYSGDPLNATSTSAAINLTVTSVPPTVTIVTATPSTVTIGQSTAYSATVTSATNSSLTGTIQFALNGTSVGNPAPLASGKATLTATPTASGTFTLTAAYSGDAANSASTSAPTTLTVASLPATLTVIAVTPGTTTVGQSTVYSAAVTSAANSTTLPTGSVQFALNGTSVGAPVALVSGKATLTASPTIAGTFTLTAAYSGDSGYAPSASASTPLVVNAMPTAVTLTASSTFLSAGDPATLTAAVTANSVITPSGTVQFFAGSISLGTAALTAGSTATLTAAYPTAGTYSLTAVYSGNPALSASTSSATSLTVAPVTTASALSLSATPATITLAATSTTPTTGTVTLATPDSFTGTVTIVCTVVATSGNAAVSPTCTLPSKTVAFTSAQTATTTVTLSTSTSSNQHNANPIAHLEPSSPVSPSSQATPTSTGAPLGGISLAALILILPAARRRNLHRLPILFFAILPILFSATLLPLTGCASSLIGSGSTAGGNGTPDTVSATPGTYTVTLIAATGAISATTTLTLTVN